MYHFCMFLDPPLHLLMPYCLAIIHFNTLGRHLELCTKQPTHRTLWAWPNLGLSWRVYKNRRGSAKGIHSLLDGSTWLPEVVTLWGGNGPTQQGSTAFCNHLEVFRLPWGGICCGSSWASHKAGSRASLGGLRRKGSSCQMWYVSCWSMCSLVCCTWMRPWHRRAHHSYWLYMCSTCNVCLCVVCNSDSDCVRHKPLIFFFGASRSFFFLGVSRLWKNKLGNIWHATCAFFVLRPTPKTRLRAGDKIRIGPQVRLVATSTLPCGGSPTLQSGGQNQKCPTSGPGGYITLLYGGSPMLQTWRQNENWTTSGPNGCITLAVSGVSRGSKRGTTTDVAHKWASWLHHPCRLRAPQRFRAGDKNRSGPQVATLATSPLPSGRSPTLHSGGQNQK